MGHDIVINGNTGRSRRTIEGIYDWKWGFHAFQGLEMGLAHAIKVALGLFSAAIDLAGARLGAVTLTETLRLDDAGASVRSTVTTFVFEVLHGMI